MVNYIAFKDFTITKPFKSISETDRDKMKLTNSWGDIKKWMSDNAGDFLNGAGNIKDQEAIDNFKSICIDGDFTTMYGKNNWGTITWGYPLANNWTLASEVIYNSLDGNKVFGTSYVLTAPALKVFKRYLGDCQATWNCWKGYIYSSETIKPEIDKGTLKIGVDVEPIWDGIFWTNDADVVKDWWSKIYAYWYGEGKFGGKSGNVGNFDVDGLKTVRQNITQLEQNQQDPKIVKEWTDDFLKDFDNKPLNVDSLKAVKAKLDQLKLTEKQFKDITDYWNDNFVKDLGSQPLSVEALTTVVQALKVIKDDYDYWKEIGFDKQFGDGINKESLGKVKDKLDTLTANQETHSPSDLKPANLPADWKEQLATLTDVKRYSDIWNQLNTYWESDFKNEFMYAPITLNALKLVRGRLNEYLNKLLAVYRTQITDATQAFFLNELSLDESDDIRPKYKDKITEIGKNSENDDYTVLLDKLNGDSNPQEVINAFKWVALISATEKAQEISNKWIQSQVSKNKQFRANKLKEFEEVKKYWDLMKDVEPIEANNPLYIKKVLDKVNRDFWHDQIKETIELWQPLN